MTAVSREEYDKLASEVRSAWDRAQTRDAGFQVIVEYGRKHGYKNVIAAIQGKVPKHYDREQSLSEWLDERHEEEASST